jgi:hypothetical protein
MRYSASMQAHQYALILKSFKITANRDRGALSISIREEAAMLRGEQRISRIRSLRSPASISQESSLTRVAMSMIDTQIQFYTNTIDDTNVQIHSEDAGVSQRNPRDCRPQLDLRLILLH